MESVLTSRTLWENFDPAAEQLDIDPIKQTERGGLVTKTLYFTGRTLPSGAKTRVFGTVCFKKTAENKPAVLVISNYSLPIEMSVLADIASRGFVAMSVDLAGRRPKGLHTIYPEELLYCNNEFARNMFEITETGYAVLYFNHDVDANASADSVAWRISIVDEEGREDFRTNSSMSNKYITILYILIKLIYWN